MRPFDLAMVKKMNFKEAIAYTKNWNDDKKVVDAENNRRFKLK